MRDFSSFWLASGYLGEMFQASYRLLNIDEMIYVFTLDDGKSDYPYDILAFRSEVEGFSDAESGANYYRDYRKTVSSALRRIGKQRNIEGTVLAFEPELAVISDGIVCFGTARGEVLRSSLNYVRETSVHLAAIAFCFAVSEIAEFAEEDGIEGNYAYSEMRRDLVANVDVPMLTAQLERERFKLARLLNVTIEPEESNSIGLRNFKVAGQPMESVRHQDVDDRTGWAFDHPPPPTGLFQHGPVEGNVKQFGEWLGVDDRVFKSRNGLSWYVQKIHGRRFNVWFPTEKNYATVNAKALAARTSENARNSTKKRKRS